VIVGGQGYTGSNPGFGDKLQQSIFNKYKDADADFDFKDEKELIDTLRLRAEIVKAARLVKINVKFARSKYKAPTLGGWEATLGDGGAQPLKIREEGIKKPGVAIESLVTPGLGTEVDCCGGATIAYLVAIKNVHPDYSNSKLQNGL